MSIIMKVLAVLAITISVAQASCPPYAPYGCHYGYNGKLICGCGK